LTSHGNLNRRRVAGEMYTRQCRRCQSSDSKLYSRLVSALDTCRGQSQRRHHRISVGRISHKQ